MERLNPQSRRDAYGSRINREPLPVLVHTIPAASVMLGSILPMLFFASAVPLVPPLGFVVLLSWRLVRPGLFALWAGFPLGLFDDLVSGQPFGSAILLWSVALIVIEIIETRFPWRSFIQDWLTMGAIMSAYLLASALISGAPLKLPGLIALGPQLAVTLMLFPVLARLIAWLDRLRLTRLRRVGVGVGVDHAR